MGAMASQITSLTTVYSTDNSGANQRKHQSSVSLAFVRGIRRWPVNSPHKWPVTQKMFPFEDVMITKSSIFTNHCRVQSQVARKCVYADRNLRNTLSYNFIYLHHHYHSCKFVIHIYIFKIYISAYVYHSKYQDTLNQLCNPKFDLIIVKILCRTDPKPGKDTRCYLHTVPFQEDSVEAFDFVDMYIKDC